jgi:hypothetical protein
MGTTPPSSPFATLATDLGSAVLLPLDARHPASAPVHLLVFPDRAAFSSPSPLPEALIVLLGAAMGLAILLTGKFHEGGRSVLPACFLLYLAPVGALWVALMSSGKKMDEEAVRFGQMEIVRALALLRDSGERLEVPVLAEATGFGVTRLQAGEVAASTLEHRGLLSRLAGLPEPRPSLPATGEVEFGSGTVPYGSMIEKDGSVLVLTGAGKEGRALRVTRLIQAGAGGAASLLGLMVMINAFPLRPGRGGRRRERTGARAL